MKTLKASATWSPNADRLGFWADAPGSGASAPEPLAGYLLAALLVELSDAEHDSGRIAGFEIFGFLGFERWEALPSLDLLWQLPGEKPATAERAAAASATPPAR